MRGDISTITGSIVILISFLISLSILHYFITFNSERLSESFSKKVEFYYEKSLELVDFLNNNTTSTSPQIYIKNIGWKSLDLKCFRVYLDSIPVNFSYSINDLNGDSLLNPGEEGIIYLEPSSSGWKLLYLVSCKGNRFETLIEFE